MLGKLKILSVRTMVTMKVRDFDGEKGRQEFTSDSLIGSILSSRRQRKGSLSGNEGCPPIHTGSMV